ncbi:MAG: PAS domain-containing protein [Deltaproteobacteria bacterium]|nr:PAS domain-containing protein [Deltaproteobacteria bacterium]
MKTVFIGGGHGCKAVLELVFQRRLAVLSPEIIGVVDPDPEAPGMVLAREHDLPTYSSVREALALPGLKLVIEVTGIDEVREEIVRLVPDRVRVMDHDMARVFWDLDEMAKDLREELNRKTVLEAVIREDRRRLQELLDSLPDAVMVLDNEGRIERVNRKFEEVTELPWPEVRGLFCRDMARGRDIDCGAEDCPRRRVLETGRALTVVQQHSCIRAACTSGDCYYQITATPVLKDRVVITSREVTEQIRLALETEELARRARQILTAVHGIITISDLDGRYQFANPSAQRFFGISADAFIGKSTTEILPPDVAVLFEDNDRALLEKGSRMTSKETFHLGGHESVLITERILLRDYKEELVGICRVSRNVTESMQLQEEIVESEKHAAVGKLAAGVAHELNNPLTGILTFSESLLDDTPEDSPVREDLEVIVRETFRCRQIVRDLLDFSRQARSNPQVLSMVPVVKKAVQLVNKQAAFQDIDFVLELDDDASVRADFNQLQQVILNLVINARDAMDGRGMLTVRARNDRDRRRVVVDVSDEGCGIAPENIDKIFEPFYSTKGQRGNGLGLAAVRSIMEQNKGAIAVQSTPGEGSIFTISLPAVSSTSS